VINSPTPPRGGRAGALLFEPATETAPGRNCIRCPWPRRNLLFTLRLFCDETDAIHFREESRHRHLDRRDRLYGRRHDLRPLTVRPILKPSWTPQDDERLQAFVAQGASVVKVAAALKRKIVSVRMRARALGCPFPTLRVARQKWAGASDNV
jgi:hypothetical protein